MKVNLYSIHDAKAGVYLSPFPMQTHGMAQRAFMDALENPQTPMCKYPLDFSLFFIGVYDDETSIIVSELPPEMIMNASQAKKATNNLKIEVSDEDLELEEVE